MRLSRRRGCILLALLAARRRSRRSGCRSGRPPNRRSLTANGGLTARPAARGKPACPRCPSRPTERSSSAARTEDRSQCGGSQSSGDRAPTGMRRPGDGIRRAPDVGTVYPGSVVGHRRASSRRVRRRCRSLIDLKAIARGAAGIGCRASRGQGLTPRGTLPTQPASTPTCIAGNGEPKRALSPPESASPAAARSGWANRRAVAALG